MTKRKVIKLGGSVWEQLDTRYFEEWKAWVETGNELLIVHGVAHFYRVTVNKRESNPCFEMVSV